MNVELMRKLDYWFGIPLCFLLTEINYILKLFSSKKKKTIHKKFLFIKLSEMGSIILAYPLMKKIQREYEEAPLFFLTFKKNAPIFQVLNIVPPSNVLTIRDDTFSKFLFDTLKVIVRIRKESIDTVFDLEFFSRFTAIVAYLTGAKMRVGFYKYRFEGLYRGKILTNNVQYNPLLHISKMYLSFAEALKLEEKFTPCLERKVNDSELVLPNIDLPIEVEEMVYNRLKNLGIDGDKRLFLINPGEGKLPLREWPIENFIKLSKMLLEDKKNYIFIVGSKEAVKNAERLFCAVNSERCISLAGKTSLLELLALFKKADVLIVNDCGLAHLGSLTSIKKIILFGPESPHIFGPLDRNSYVIYVNLPCSPCFSVFNHRSSACRDNKCLKLIKAEEIYDLVKNLIGF